VRGASVYHRVSWGSNSASSWAERQADQFRPRHRQIHHLLRHISYQANRLLGVISILLNLAESWNLRPAFTNTCRSVKKYKEKVASAF
jgi:hypothetical protein